MRILQLLSQMQPTGAEAYAVTVADWLTDQGHEVYFVSDRLHTKTRQTYIPLAVHKNALSIRIQSTRKLRQLLKEKNIQVVHCHSRAAARLAFWATRGLKIAVVSTIHGRQPVSFSKKILDIYGDKVICICENLQSLLTSRLRMNPRKMRLIRNPINATPLSFVESLKPEPRIAWIGRFTGPKGERAKQFLDQVVPQLLTEFPDLHIDVIGGEAALLGPREPHPRLHFQSHLTQLDQELSQYQLVFAAGRIAMSSLIRGIPTYAIGEYKSEGLINSKESLLQALKSNFGDIGADGQATSEVDFQQLRDQALEFLKNPRTLPIPVRQSLRDVTLKNFAQESVCCKIYNTYKSAYFLKNHPRTIPVLMYHKVPNQDLSSPHRIFITKENFKKHLEYFKAQGFSTLHFRELEEFRSGKKAFSEFPKKPLILTFDDGYVDNLTNAAPLLRQFGLKAVIYLLADPDLRDNSWDADGKEPLQALMSLEQKRQLLEFDFEIGSHGFRHQKITDMNEVEARHELQASKAQLEKDFGTSVTSYAYTYGVTSPEAARLAEEAGYDFAVNTDSGGLHLEENPYAIFRINIFPEDGPAQLRKKTSAWYRRYFYFKRGR